jgi:outer membrane protein OmpA-like peptidoglycan-associated protein
MKRNQLNLAAITLLILLVSNAAFAQKKGDKSALFLNSTFEDFKDKSISEISEPGQIIAIEGLEPTIVEYPADIFFGSGDYGAGQNIYGFAAPKNPKDESLTTNDRLLFINPKAENNAYAGIVTYKPGKLQKEKTYITIPFVDAKGKLKKMTPGKFYCVEMSISLAEASKYATNNIGMMFVKNHAEYEKIEMATGGQVNFEEGRLITNYKNRVYNSYSDWDKVCNVYKAKGDETGVVIGNFMINDKTTAMVQKKITKLETGAEAATLLPLAYYYIDNIRIKEVANKTECNCFKADTAAASYEYSTVVMTIEPVVSDKMTIAEKIGAQTIYYAFGKSNLSSTGKSSIDYVIEQMKANPNVKVTVLTHNDEEEDRAAEEFEDLKEDLENMDEKRGELIKALLIKGGISESRFMIDPKGASMPNTKEASSDEDPSDKELQWARNRRVEFVVQN